jgi:hypothetical protein
MPDQSQLRRPTRHDANHRHGQDMEEGDQELAAQVLRFPGEEAMKQTVITPTTRCGFCRPKAFECCALPACVAEATLNIALSYIVEDLYPHRKVIYFCSMQHLAEWAFLQLKNENAQKPSA